MENYTQQFEAIENESKTRSISSLLDQIESRLGKMTKGVSKDGLLVLIEMDTVYRRMKDYNGSEDGLRAEITQFEYIQTLLRSNMSLLLRQVGGPAQLAALRSQRKP
jgi:hypothetical protein